MPLNMDLQSHPRYGPQPLEEKNVKKKEKGIPPYNSRLPLFVFQCFLLPWGNKCLPFYVLLNDPPLSGLYEEWKRIGNDMLINFFILLDKLSKHQEKLFEERKRGGDYSLRYNSSTPWSCYQAIISKPVNNKGK